MDEKRTGRTRRGAWIETSTRCHTWKTTRSRTRRVRGLKRWVKEWIIESWQSHPQGAWIETADPSHTTTGI